MLLCMIDAHACVYASQNAGKVASEFVNVTCTNVARRGDRECASGV